MYERIKKSHAYSPSPLRNNSSASMWASKYSPNNKDCECKKGI